MEKRIEKIYNDGTRKAIITLRLSDPCGNGHNDFAITAICKAKDWEGKWVEYCGGACHDEIVLACPELAEYIPLHLSDEQGKPIYYFENTIYWYEEKGIVNAAKYLRLSVDTAERIFDEYNAKSNKAEGYCKENRALWDEILTKYGIFDQWRKEADKLKAYIKGL